MQRQPIGCNNIPCFLPWTAPIEGSFCEGCVAAASLLIASRGGVSPQKFEKRALTIFRLEPGPYESAHQLDCSILLPTAMATELKALSKVFVSKSSKQQTSAVIDRQHGFWNTTETN